MRIYKKTLPFLAGLLGFCAFSAFGTTLYTCKVYNFTQKPITLTYHSQVCVESTNSRLPHAGSPLTIPAGADGQMRFIRDGGSPGCSGDTSSLQANVVDANGGLIGIVKCTYNWECFVMHQKSKSQILSATNQGSCVLNSL